MHHPISLGRYSCHYLQRYPVKDHGEPDGGGKRLLCQHSEGRSRQMSVSSRLGWSTTRVRGQPGFLHRDTLSQKQTNKDPGDYPCSYTNRACYHEEQQSITIRKKAVWTSQVIKERVQVSRHYQEVGMIIRVVMLLA